MLSLALILLCAATIQADLIGVSLPCGAHASYYKCMLGNKLDDICNFIHDYANAVSGTEDRLMVVYPKDEDHCLDIAELRRKGAYPIGVPSIECIDIWMRDFGTVFANAADPVKFGYQPGYIKNAADAKQNSQDFVNLLEKVLYETGSTYQLKKSDINLDGGNVVDNRDYAILTNRTFKENGQKTAATIKAGIEKEKPSTNFKFCYLADVPSDTTGHSDGVCSFIDENTLAVADYGLPEYNTDQNIKIIKGCFPGLNVLKMDNRNLYEGKEMNLPAECSQTRFTTATGSSINLLASATTLYVPTFDTVGFDNTNELNWITSNTNKAVKTVDTGKLSHMGGSVRCMSWQININHPIAKAVIAYSQSQAAAGIM